MRKTYKSITSRLHAHVCVHAGTHTVRMCYAIREAIESLTACTYVRILYCRKHSAYDFPRQQRGDKANMRYRATAKKLPTVCVRTRERIVYVCEVTRTQKRTRQSRIPIALSRYGASCGAATIKAPVTHCSYLGQ